MPIKIIIESPCSERLSVASGDSTGFHCATCNKTVIDMRGRTKKESVALLRSVESPCAIFRTNSAGAIIFEPERPGKNLVPESLLPLALVVAGVPPANAQADILNDLRELREVAYSSLDESEIARSREVRRNQEKRLEAVRRERGPFFHGWGLPFNNADPSKDDCVFPGFRDKYGSCREPGPEDVWGDIRIAESADIFLTFMNGAFACLLMVLSGLGGICSLLFAGIRKSKRLFYVALILGCLAMVTFLVRSSISTYFNDVSLRTEP
jgi:hypothetical protein